MLIHASFFLCNRTIAPVTRALKIKNVSSMYLIMSTAANVSKVSLENIVSQVRMLNMAELFIKIWGGGGREGGKVRGSRIASLLLNLVLRPLMAKRS